MASWLRKAAQPTPAIIASRPSTTAIQPAEADEPVDEPEDVPFCFTVGAGVSVAVNAYSTIFVEPSGNVTFIGTFSTVPTGTSLFGFAVSSPVARS